MSKLNKRLRVVFIASLVLVVAALIACSTVLFANANITEGDLNKSSGELKYSPNEALICVKTSNSAENAPSDNSLQSLQNTDTVINSGGESYYGYTVKSKLTTNPLSVAVEKEVADGGENVQKIVEGEESSANAKQQNSNNLQNSNSLQEPLDEGGNSTDDTQASQTETQTCNIFLVSCGDVESFCKNITNDASVIWAQPNYIYELDDDKQAIDEVTQENKANNEEKIDTNADAEATENTDKSTDKTAESTATNKTDNTFTQTTEQTNNQPYTPNDYKYNDPGFSKQWGYDGQETGTQYSINAESAWNETDPTNTPVVAVIDTGIDYDHPDIAGNMWDQGQKVPELAALGSGKYGINTSGGTKTEIMDDNEGHGTHCASAIGAVCNNTKGICGVGNNKVKLMGCKVFPKSGGASTSSIIDAFNYVVVAKKANVNVAAMSCSFGTSSRYSDYDYGYSSMLIEAGKNGIVSCFSAGNEATDMDQYSNRNKRSPYSVSIGSSSTLGAASNFSCYGKHSVDVFSPGSNILACAAISEGSAKNGNYLPFLQNAQDNYYYEDFSGTSSKIKFKYYDGSTFTELPYTISNGKAIIDVSNIPYNNTSYVFAEIPKTEIAGLVSDTSAVPYVCQTIGFDNCSVYGDKVACFGLNSSGAKAEYDYWVRTDNKQSTVHSYKANDRSFVDRSGDNVYIGFRIQITQKGTNPKITMDDIGLGKSASDYAYMNGTSMACPIAAGIVSYISAYKGFESSASHALEVAACLKGSTNYSSALDSKCVTSGVVDLSKAVSGLNGTTDNHNPVPQSVECTKVSETAETYQCKLSGYFFGSQGSLTLDGTAVTDITSWSDKEIRFTIPACTEHTGEFVVTSAGKTGRAYLDVKTDTLGYTDLPVSTLSYTDPNGVQYTSSDLNALHSATTNKAFYVLYGSVNSSSKSSDHSIVLMERYDFATKQWSTVDFSSLESLTNYGYTGYFSMASGQDELYFLYRRSNGKYQIATYSENSNSFIFDKTVSVARTGDMICNVDGELWLAGKDKSASSGRSKDVVSIYPDTGAVKEEIGDLPAYISGGNMTSYGDYVVIADSATNYRRSPYNDSDTTPINEPYICDKSQETKTWVKGSNSLYYSSTLIDPDQFLCSAGVAVDKGVLEIGMVKDNATSSMTDHYLQDYSSKNWSRNSSARFASYKCRNIVGAFRENKVYVLGKNGLDCTTRFRVMDLSTIGAASQDVTKPAARETSTSVSGTTVESSKDYDGNTNLNVSSKGSLTGIEAGDTVDFTATATFEDKNVGEDKKVTVSYTLTGKDAYKYSTPANNVELTSSITAADLSVTGTKVAESKVYDANTNCEVTNVGKIEGKVEGDDLTITPTATYSDKKAGSEKDVTVSFAKSGADANNYNAPDNVGLKSSINAKSLAITGSKVNQKEYDAKTNAVVTVGTVGGVIGDDKVTVAATGVYDDKTAGVDKNCTVTYSLSGDDGGNYSVTSETLKGTIAKKSLTITDTKVKDKTYNGNSDAEFDSVGNLVGVLDPDTVAPTATGTFDSKDVGENHTVGVVFGLSGGDAANYNAPESTLVTGVKINAIQLTISGTVVNEKTYDSTKAATVATLGTVEGVLEDEKDKVSVLVDSAEFVSADAKDKQDATVTYKLSGGGAGNYLAPVQANLQAKISPKVINVKADDKTSHVGTQQKELTYTADKLYDGDSFSGALSATVDTSKTGTYTISQGDLSLSSNYSISFTHGTYTVVDKTIQTLTFEESSVSKTYGDDPFTKAAAGTVTPAPEYSSSVPSVAEVVLGTGEVTIKGVGSTIITAKTPGDEEHSSASASYTLTVSARQLSVTGTSVAEKTYDTTTNANITLGTVVGKVEGDDIVVTPHGAFADKKVGNKTVNVTYTLSGTKANNYIAPSADDVSSKIKVASLSESGSTCNAKTYDGNKTANITKGSLVGVLSGDDVNFMVSGEFDSQYVDATKVTLTFNMYGADANNYTSLGTKEITGKFINKKQLTISSPTCSNKTYDGNTTAQVTIGSVSGIVNGDAVTVNGAGAFRDRNAEINKTVDVTYSLSGQTTLTQNYIVPTSNTITAAITPKTMKVTADAQSTVVGQPIVNPLTFTHDDFCHTEDKFVGALATNANKDSIGEYDITQGNLTAANYTIAFTGAKYTVNPKQNQTLKFEGVGEQGVTVTYGDADFTQVATGGSTTPEYTSNNTSVATVDSNGKVTILRAGSATITATSPENDWYYGTSANYTITVNRKQLSISGTKVNNKTYNKSTEATVECGQLAGGLQGDIVTVTATGAFDNYNVENNKDVLVKYTLSASAAVNYLAPSDETLKANITPAPLTVTGTKVEQKTYNASDDSEVTTGSLSGIFEGDSVSIKSATGKFSSITAGGNKTVTVTYEIEGTSASNYSAPSNEQITGLTINKAQLTADSTSVSSKTYDRSTTADVEVGEISGKFGSDEVNVVATGKFDNFNVGDNKDVTVTYSISGAAAGNYLAPSAKTITGKITAKDIKVTADAKSSTVHQPLAVLTYKCVPELFAGDTFSGSLSTTANKDVEGTYPITSSLKNSNYNITYVKADYKVTAKAVQTLSFEGISGGKVSKTYGDPDFTYAATGATTAVTYSTSDSDVASVGATSGKVSIHKVGSCVITAKAAEDDFHSSAEVSYTLNIDAKPLTVSETTVQEKTYDGKLNAMLNLGELGGVVSGDKVTLGYTANFNDKNVGNSKNVSVTYSLSGDSASNYYAPAATTLSGSITPKEATITGTTVDDSKTYDGKLSANVTCGTISNLVIGDVVTVSAIGAYDSKDVGTNKTVTVAYVLSDTDANNYSINKTEEFTGKSINAVKLGVEGTQAKSKTYNGSTIADISIGTVTGKVGNDDVEVSAGGVFSDKNAGQGKSVGVTYQLSGNDAGNYLVPDATTVTANISPKEIVVQAEEKTSKVGQDIVALTYTCTPALISGDSFTGGLSTNANKDVVGNYDILQNDLSAGINYSISYSGAKYHVTEKTVQIVTFDGLEGKTSLTKTYGEKSFTQTVSGNKTPVSFESSDPSVATIGSTSGQIEVKKAGSTTITVNAEETADYAPTSASYLLVVVPKQLAVEGSKVKDKVYNGSTDAEIVGSSLIGLVSGDTVTLTYNAKFDNSNVGEDKSVKVNYTILGDAAVNYQAPLSKTLTGKITAAPLTVTGTTVDNKVYDGSELATVHMGNVTGMVSGDDITVSSVGLFNTKGAGTNKDVHIVYYVAGTSAGNYSAPQSEDLKANIAKAPLSVSGTSVADKVYDGTTAANVVTGNVAGKVGDDNVNVAADGTFASKDVGVDISVAVTYSLSGGDSSNYVAPASDTLVADITARAISVVAEDKATYVGSPLADLTYTCTPALCQGDKFSGALTCSADKNVVKEYAIENGSLSAGTNYAMSFTPGVYRVTAKQVQTLTFAGVPGGTLNKKYGDDSYTETVSGAATSVTYSSTASDVASVDQQTGAVSIHKTGSATIVAQAAETAEWAPATASYQLNVSVADRLVVAANSASKEYDGTPLTDSGVHLQSGRLASGDTVEATVEGTITNIGKATNRISGDVFIRHDGADVTSYYAGIDKVDGELVVNGTAESPVVVDTEAVSKILEKYRAIPELSDKNLSVEVKMDTEVAEKDKEMIKDEIGDKSVEYISADLLLFVDGQANNIGSDNKEVISIAYKFDFAHAADMQVFRVHTEAKPLDKETKTLDEITTTPNAAGEYVTYEKDYGRVVIAASKYSTFGIAYNYVADPEPGPQPSPDTPSDAEFVGASTTGSTCDLTAFAVAGLIAIAALSCFVARRAKCKEF